MSVPRYVQHISGHGKKWVVLSQSVDETYYIVEQTTFGVHFSLPVSEYQPCEPPERWVDVTSEVEYRAVSNEGAGLFHHGKAIAIWNGYRLRKVSVNLKPMLNEPSQWAFIVERREP